MFKFLEASILWVL